MKRPYVASLVVALLLAVSVAAQTSATSQTTGTATQSTSATAGKAGTSATSATGGTASQAATTTTQGASAQAAAAAASQASGAVSIPAGTKIPAVLSKSVDSKKAKAGDKVEARTVANIVSQGKVVIPKDSKLIGHVTESKAKASGEAESRLGIVFDQIVMRKGQTIPMTANIQAIGAAVTKTAASTDAMEMGSSGSYGGGASGSSGGSTGGGLLGGATGTVGSTAGGAVGAVGGVTDSATQTVGGVGSTVGAATQGTVGAAGSTVGLHGTLNSNSTGVVGLKDLQLSSSSEANAGASVVTSSGKSVKLDSGSQLMLNVSGSQSAPASKSNTPEPR